jgi:hypothetical protein
VAKRRHGVVRATPGVRTAECRPHARLRLELSHASLEVVDAENQMVDLYGPLGLSNHRHGGNAAE